VLFDADQRQRRQLHSGCGRRGAPSECPTCEQNGRQDRRPSRRSSKHARVILYLGVLRRR
jgi:hypothetical protein